MNFAVDSDYIDGDLSSEAAAPQKKCNESRWTQEAKKTLTRIYINYLIAGLGCTYAIIKLSAFKQWFRRKSRPPSTESNQK